VTPFYFGIAIFLFVGIFFPIFYCAFFLNGAHTISGTVYGFCARHISSLFATRMHQKLISGAYLNQYHSKIRSLTAKSDFVAEKKGGKLEGARSG